MRSGAVGLTLAIVVAACTAPAVAPSPEPTPVRSSATTDTTPSSDASVPPAAAPPSPSPTPTVLDTPTAPPVAIGQVDAGYAFERLAALADGVGRRVPGTEGDRAAQSLITDWFGQAGWHVTRDVVPLPQGGETANLLATIDPAGVPVEGPLVVVGSHMDTLGGVGANDNASGVGVLMAVAEELRDEAAAFPITVVLVAFAAEERQEAPGRPNHLGSEQLAATLANRTVAMLSVDMVGNGPTTRIMGLDGAATTLVDRLASVAQREEIADVVTGAGGNISDHGAFAERGVPAAFLWTGPDDRLHTNADTTDQIDLEDLSRAGALTLALLRDLSATDLPTLQPTTAP